MLVNSGSLTGRLEFQVELEVLFKLCIFAVSTIRQWAVSCFYVLRPTGTKRLAHEYMASDSLSNPFRKMEEALWSCLIWNTCVWKVVRDDKWVKEGDGNKTE